MLELPAALNKTRVVIEVQILQSLGMVILRKALSTSEQFDVILWSLTFEAASISCVLVSKSMASATEVPFHKVLGIHPMFSCSVFCCLMKPINVYSWGGWVAKYMNLHAVLNNFLSGIVPIEPQKVQDNSTVFSNNGAVVSYDRNCFFSEAQQDSKQAVV